MVWWSPEILKQSAFVAMKLVVAVLNIWFFILCSKKKKNKRIVGGSSIRVIPKSRSIEMEPTQRRNTYTPVMEKTQRHTQESEGKNKGTLATAEQLETGTSDEKKKGTPEGIKLSKDSKKLKLRTAELPTSKDIDAKEPVKTAEWKKDSKGSKSNENVHTAEKLSNEKKIPQEKPTQKGGSKDKRVAKENIKDKPVPQQDNKEKLGSKENNKDKPVPKANIKDKPVPKEDIKTKPAPEVNINTKPPLEAKVEAKPTPEEKVEVKPVPVEKENNKKNAKAGKQTEAKAPEKKSIEEFKTAEEGEIPKKKSPPSETSLKEPERKHSEYLIYRAELLVKDKPKTKVKEKKKMMGKSKATRSPNPKGFVESVECG
ncbi:hypothetical protein Aduo_010998 [Ancylostoma duodenale]